MNEILFFTQFVAVLAALYSAVRTGRAGLVALIALSGVLANLFVVKEMVLFGLHVTCSDMFAVGGILGLNVLQELYGREAAREGIRTSLFLLIFFAVFSQIHLLFLPSGGDQTHEAFTQILSSTPRIVVASILSYYLVQRMDLVCFSVLKKWFSSFSIRVFLSLLFSQAIDTILFSFLGLYGLVESIFDIILVSFAVKFALIACSSPLSFLLKMAAKKELA
jgi:uncharacterized integral membrane protein (TIGR00697 family)